MLQNKFANLATKQTENGACVWGTHHVGTAWGEFAIGVPHAATGRALQRTLIRKAGVG